MYNIAPRPSARAHEQRTIAMLVTPEVCRTATITPGYNKRFQGVWQLANSLSDSRLVKGRESSPQMYLKDNCPKLKGKAYRCCKCHILGTSVQARSSCSA